MKTAHDLVAEAKAHIREIDPNAAEQAIRDADLLLDVREPEEFHAGHIPGALNIPRGVLEFKIGSEPQLAERDLDIVLYCKTGGRAALAARALKEMGYLQVHSIAGGFEAWEAAGKPVARPSQPSFE